MDNLLNAVHLYFRLIGITVRGQMQYRASFLLMTFGNFIVTFIEFVGILVLFSRFGSLQGWQLEEAAVLYGMINCGYALSEAFGRGFDKFDLQVIHGEFDRTFLRPRSTGLQVLAHDFELLRVGRLLQGLVILVWGFMHLGVAWNPAKVLLLGVSILGNVGIFTGLMVIQATMCFWSTQGLELMNSFTSGGVEAVQWPLPIYRKWFAAFFIAVVPLACVNYFPVLAVLEKADPLNSPVWFHWAAPLAGFIFFGLSFFAWKFGVRHYNSTGS